MTLEDQLRRDEGVSRVAYRDSLGNWSIAIGHLIRLPAEAWMLSAVLTDEQIDAIFEADVAEAKRDLGNPPWFAGLDECRQGAVLNMAFNMGAPELLSDWPHFQAALGRGDWAGAAAQMRSPAGDPWAHQVGARAERLAKQIETGVWQ